MKQKLVSNDTSAFAILLTITEYAAIGAAFVVNVVGKKSLRNKSFYSIYSIRGLEYFYQGG
ncbi:hypothetical protein [Selenomonas ruminantium]|uniref:hypothetical protein n=1 Tax=Selenomonas ruminantium TaxID=971 RepID=UPI0015A343AC|nr:hypothetical protein [Selenomonas ruminantium]